MKIIVLALALGVAYGACPNGCSGHGSCGTSDVCDCYNGWWGGDCSYRACARGVSWTATSYDDLTDDRNAGSLLLATPGAHSDSTSSFSDVMSDLYPLVASSHRYTECSSRGVCDYSTGECKCFDGFEGKGCRRSSCPNDCSGHGRCLTNEEVSSSSSYMRNNDQFWDQDKSQQCSCDRGFTGYDCSSRVCPFGDDPTTECGENSAGDYQLVNVQVSTASGSYFTLRFTDMFGGEFETRPINNDACTAAGSCSEVQYALQELPNFAIPDVQVDLLTGLGTSNEKLYRVAFTDSANVGKQNTLACNQVSDPSGEGSSPKYAKTADCAVLDVGLPEWFDDAGNDNSASTIGGSSLSASDILSDVVADTSDSSVSYDSFVPCSNKGLCDDGSGGCSCFDGHYGEACSEQSTYY